MKLRELMNDRLPENSRNRSRNNNNIDLSDELPRGMYFVLLYDLTCIYREVD
jgi:hypothetical protein